MPPGFASGGIFYAHRHVRRGARIEWRHEGGMRMGGRGAPGRHLAGALLTAAGVLIVFLCLPMRFFLVALGILLAAAGLLLLR